MIDSHMIVIRCSRIMGQTIGLMTTLTLGETCRVILDNSKHYRDPRCRVQRSGPSAPACFTGLKRWDEGR